MEPAMEVKPLKPARRIAVMRLILMMLMLIPAPQAAERCIQLQGIIQQVGLCGMVALTTNITE